jgi:DNA polymerase elongation subunit (family B)
MPKNNIVDFDFASLYPTTMKVFNIDKSKYRREKIERLIQKMYDKRIGKELSTE